MKKNKTIKPSRYKIPLKKVKLSTTELDAITGGADWQGEVRQYLDDTTKADAPKNWKRRMTAEDFYKALGKDAGREFINHLKEQEELLGTHEKSEIESAIYQYTERAQELSKVIAEAQADLKLYGQVLIEKLTLLYGGKV